jgi:hypothetical protein
VNLEGLPKNKNHQFHLVLVILGQPIELIDDGSLQSVEFTCDSNDYIHALNIVNLAEGETLKNIRHHLTVVKNMEVRVKGLPNTKLVQFLDKFDFERLYCIWGEMLKHYKNLNPVDGFNMFIRISFRLFKHLSSTGPHRKLPHQISVMRAVFSLLQKGFRSFRSLPDLNVAIELKDIKANAYYLYHLYVSAFLPK